MKRRASRDGNRGEHERNEAMRRKMQESEYKREE
jgi:hypothetical protein